MAICIQKRITELPLDDDENIFLFIWKWIFLKRSGAIIGILCQNKPTFGWGRPKVSLSTWRKIEL